MKRIFAIALLFLSFASVALADGPDFPPTGNVASPTTVGVVLLADGSGWIPPASQTKPLQGTSAA
jgi:hypothetical protein